MKKDIKLTLDEALIKRIDAIIPHAKKRGDITGTTRNKLFKFLFERYEDEIMSIIYF